MALTVTLGNISEFGDRRTSWGYFASPTTSSYPSGGYSFTAAQMGLQNVEQVIISPWQGYTFDYDYTNSKVKVYTASGTEATTVSIYTLSAVRWLAIGLK